MTRTCEVCGREFEAQRSTRKSCSSSCRVYKSQGRKVAPVKVLPSAATDTAAVPVAVGSVEARTLAAVSTLELTEDPQAAVALVLARRLDSPSETGAAVAALAKQYAALMDDLSRRGVRAADPLDELRARLVAKASGA